MARVFSEEPGWPNGAFQISGPAGHLLIHTLAKTGAACIGKPQQNVSGRQAVSPIPSATLITGTLKSYLLADGQLFLRASKTFGLRCALAENVLNSGIPNKFRDNAAWATQSRNSPIIKARSRTECNQGQTPCSARMHSCMLQIPHS